MYGRFITCLLLLIYLYALQAQDLKQILVFTKNGPGYVHDNRAAASACLIKIGEELGYKVHVSDNAKAFKEADLKHYSLLIFASTNNEVFENNEQRLAFRRYIENGGKFLGIHSALGTERNWSWFKQLLGGTFDTHPPFQDLKIYNTMTGHPSISGLPMNWPKEDECYFLKEEYDKGMVLMEHLLDSIKNPGSAIEQIKKSGSRYPAVWTKSFDGGQVWITALGHHINDYTNPQFIQHLRQGIQFLLNVPTPNRFIKPYTNHFDQPLQQRMAEWHAHNDYEHDQPLVKALQAGFHSVEADIHLHQGRLLVGHNQVSNRSPELTELYLKPLDSLCRIFNGFANPGGRPFTLMIDIKTDGAETYHALQNLLNSFPSLVQGKVSLLLSGNVPKQEILKEAVSAQRICVDGRPEDLGKGIPSRQMPWISDRYSKWSGGDLGLEKIINLAKKVHEEGKILRLWGIPDDPASHQKLFEAGVDIINSDQLGAPAYRENE
ncbi:MAG: ThuA domain-containing protein [Bacteroidetes bacterium]|nr:ThuA domain-containing protein [Bacteroidota bacterium]